MGIEVSSYALSPNCLLGSSTWWICLRGIQYPVSITFDDFGIVTIKCDLNTEKQKEYLSFIITIHLLNKQIF